MRFLYDYFPVLCFFIVYKLYGIYIATAATMGICLVQVGVFWLINRRFENLHLIILAFVWVLGGATLIFHQEMFIKWKPSIVYWVFSLILLKTQLFDQKPLVQKLLGDKVLLEKSIWRRLNLFSIFFFFALGVLNLYIIYNFDTNTWVNFKLFGTLGLIIGFSIGTALYIACHSKPEKSH